MSLRSLAFGVAVLIALPSAAMAGGEIIGDSLGVGVSWAAKLPSLAKLSIAIHGGQILEQIRQLPRGTTAFMSLGTNDAVGGAVDVKKPVQDILAAAAAQDVKLVWLGPPCVFKPWDAYAIKLDANLRQELEGTGVIYVSMRGPDICDRSLRGAEGVHFNMAGYTLMWQKAAAAAGFPVVTVASNQNQPVIRDNKKRKPVKHRHRKKNPPAPAAPAPAPEVAPGAN
ncbi:SGNH/GDSL hydrolase family protein [Methylocapsa sp. S129]|uniref:SGNH/GDSL hydrolase family protein n=1 Tax=Methylocapsa sp. S129 TaxID=1641869 RepID=UPI00131E2FB2|nr:SGNH/GDSL hydrolase family protein [Methylocapsa sp. S129]